MTPTPVRRVLLAVDPVEPWSDEAVGAGADLLVTHHPLLLRRRARRRGDRPQGRAVVTGWCAAGVALHVAHTNADVARPGGLRRARGRARRRATCGRSRRPGRTDAATSSSSFVPHADADARARRAGRRRRRDASATTSAAPGRPTGTGPFRAAARRATRRRRGRASRSRSPRRGSRWCCRAPRAAAVVRGAARGAPVRGAGVRPARARPTCPAARGIGRVGRAAPSRCTLREFAGRVGAAPARRRPTGVRVAGDPTASVDASRSAAASGDDLLDDGARRAARTSTSPPTCATTRRREAREHGRPALVDAAHWATEWPWLRRRGRRARRVGARRRTTVETRVSEHRHRPLDASSRARSPR